ncbi:hypothetical protein B0H12DRAFT_444690 [Mycena haematopus]|nr:hypothetical protein B0H12DRAFT_444690 [Mycena haematopus]
MHSDPSPHRRTLCTRTGDGPVKAERRGAATLSCTTRIPRERQRGTAEVGRERQWMVDGERGQDGGVMERRRGGSDDVLCAEEAGGPEGRGADNDEVEIDEHTPSPRYEGHGPYQSAGTPPTTIPLAHSVDGGEGKRRGTGAEEGCCSAESGEAGVRRNRRSGRGQ